MRHLLQSHLTLRIDRTAVTAELTHWRGDVTRYETEIAPDADPTAATLAAVSTTLDAAVRRRRLVRPLVTIALACDRVSSGVVRFDALPRSAADRHLVVAQRFCRDHKLDARSTVVAFSVYALPGGQIAVLADAAPRGLIDGLIGICAGHGVHCDLVCSDLSLATCGVRPSQLGVLGVFAEGGCTLLFFGRDGAPVGVATQARDAHTLVQRVSVRLARYAAQSGVDEAQLAFYASDPSGTAADAVATLTAAHQESGARLTRPGPARGAATHAANFSRDTRRLARSAAVAAVMLALCVSGATGWLAALARDSTERADAADVQVARIERAVADSRKTAADAPATGVFERLQERIAALNALDYGATPSVIASAQREITEAEMAASEPAGQLDTVRGWKKERTLVSS